MKSKDYTQYLTKEDKINVSFTQNRGKISNFSVNYSSLINGRWRHIMRVDNCHGQPHRHTYHLHRKEYRVILGSNVNMLFFWIGFGVLLTSISRNIFKMTGVIASIKNNPIKTMPIGK